MKGMSSDVWWLRRLSCRKRAGSDRVTILLLDGSDNDTVPQVDQVVEEYRKKHFEIEVLWSGNRVAFRAGALQAALERTEEESIPTSPLSNEAQQFYQPAHPV